MHLITREEPPFFRATIASHRSLVSRRDHHTRAVVCCAYLGGIWSFPVCAACQTPQKADTRLTRTDSLRHLLWKSNLIISTSSPEPGPLLRAARLFQREIPKGIRPPTPGFSLGTR